MPEKMSESSGPVLGCRVLDKVTIEDYQQLYPEVQALVDQYDDVYLLLDLQEVTGEEVKAWLPDLKFGHRFHEKIDKMAMVGDKHWGNWLTALADPFLPTTLNSSTQRKSTRPGLGPVPSQFENM